MKREIKFRGYDVENETMYYSNNAFHFNSPLRECDIKNAPFELNELMQYTGLKDKKGVEIYEGDIVMHGIVKTKSKVEFIGGSFALNNEKTMHNTCIRHYGLDECEVIGNIYENPELLSTK